MKRLLTLLAMFFIIAAAQAQNITNAEYFFDSDPGPGNGTAITVSSPGAAVNINTSVSTASLSNGFHFIGLRVKDANGVWSLYEKRGFYVSSAATNAADITTAEYFFDTDPGPGNGTALSVGASGSTVNFTANIPISLSTGFHFLAIRVKGSDGIWGLYEKRGFYISSATSNAADITAAEYFFDTDPGAGNGTALSVGANGSTVNFTTNIPTSLSTGFHFLAIRVKGTDGKWGLYEKRGFYISSATTNAADITAAEYFFDADPGPGNGTSLSVGASGSTVNFTANIPTSLSTGFHFLAIRVKGTDGKWGLYEKRGFYVSAATSNMANITAAEYFFDADPGIGNGTALTFTTPGATVNQTFLIAEPGLSLGTHYLSVRVKDANGFWSLYEYDTLTVGNSTISCPANVSVNGNAGACSATVNNIDPTVNPPQAYTYTLTGATTGTGSGTASGKSFNAGVTTVNYKLTGSPTVTCSFTVTVTAAAPSVSQQPASQSVCAGSNVTFSVTAAGSGLTYQWRKGGVNISGATSSTYTITGVSTGDAGNYDVVITSPCSLSTTSSTAVLTVGNTTITSQPASQTVCTGSNAVFSVTATGSGLTYQWRKGGINISGANLSSYSITGVTAANAGNYDVVVTGACGSATSNTVALNINAATIINTNPSSQIVCAGSNVTFTAAATGTGTITYQWRKGGINISGATSAIYTITGVAANDAGLYEVVATGACGSALSSSAILTVNAVTAIAAQPSNQSSCLGGSITFSVTASGTNLTYQWQKAGVNINGATASSYTVNPVTAGDAANYAVVVTGTCGTVTSGNASLSITAGTTINTQPANQSSCLGGSVTFSVAASGSGTVTYQWQKNSVNISGANASTYTINPVTAGDAANYSVTVTSLCGSTTSNNASLTIIPNTTINSQPVSQTICTGGNVTFSVTASGNNLSYQWRKGGVNINGATSSAYTINGVTTADVAGYSVAVSGTCGVITSNTASLTLGDVVITAQPTGQTVCAGNNVTFSVSASGNGITYQWRKNGININGASSSSFTINTVTGNDGANYDVIVGGTCGAVTSNSVALIVNTPPVINIQPVNQAVCTGSDVTFSVTASGTNLTYQWRKNSVNINGANSSSYTITGVTAANEATYDVVVAGACTPSVTSNGAVLTINSAPAIISQPVSQTIFAGANVTFSVTASGNGLTYQWRKDGVNISGAASSTYTINGAVLSDGGDYDVVITGTCPPAAISNKATLTVSAIAITAQPQSQSVCTGSNVTFTITVSGNNPSYQWQVSTGGGIFTNINGATSASLTLNGVSTSMNANQYRCVLNGSVNSNAALLTVNPLPAVTLALPFDTLYQNSPIVTLSGGLPANGVFSGMGVAGGKFNPYGPDRAGNYAVDYTYTDANGCTNTATDIVTILVKTINISIYPNPVNDGNLTVVVSNELVGGKAAVYDAKGNKVDEWTVSGKYNKYRFRWATGVYFIRVINGANKATQSFINTR